MMLRLSVALCSTFVFCAPSAWADAESDRRRAMSDAERLVDNIERSLSGLTRASSTRPISDALRSADRLKSKLRDLERVKENDSKARSMLSDYGRNIDELKDARRPLETLKNGQFKLKSLEDDCKRKSRSLEDAIKDALSNDGSGSEKKLRDLAKTLGREAESALNKAERQERDMDRAESDARSFRTSGSDWNGVERAIGNAARGMHDAWERDFDKGKRACEPLTRGERHSDVSRALSTLKKNREKRADLMEELEDRLKETGRSIGRAGGARDAGDIKKADGDLAKLEQGVKQLARMKGSDKKAKSISKQWPKTAGQARKALKGLSKQKSVQFALKNLAGQCASKSKALAAQARAAVAKPEQASRKALVKAVKQGARDGKDVLKTASQSESTMERGQKNAKRISGSGAWSDLARGIKDAADQMAGQFAKDLKAVQSACVPLSQGAKEKNMARSLDEISKILDRVDRLLEAADNEVKSLASQIKSARDGGGVDRLSTRVDGIENTLSTLSKDVDPRAQKRGKAWKGALKPVRSALGGLKTAKSLQSTFDLPTKRCGQLNGEIEKKAGKVANEEALNTLAQDLKSVQTEAVGIIAAAETASGEMKSAVATAQGFGFSAGPWSSVGSALQGSSAQSLKTFQEQHTKLRATCSEPAKGAQHSAMMEKRKALQTRLDGAAKSVQSSQAAAEKTCQALAELLEKRGTWAKPITKQSNQVLDKGARDVKASMLKVLLTGVERLDLKISAAGKKCDAALTEYLKADTEFETLQGR